MVSALKDSKKIWDTATIKNKSCLSLHCYHSILSSYLLGCGQSTQNKILLSVADSHFLGGSGLDEAVLGVLGHGGRGLALQQQFPLLLNVLALLGDPLLLSVHTDTLCVNSYIRSCYMSNLHILLLL